MLRSMVDMDDALSAVDQDVPTAKLEEAIASRRRRKANPTEESTDAPTAAAGDADE